MFGHELGLGFLYWDRYGHVGTTHDAKSYALSPIPDLLCRGRVWPDTLLRGPEYALVDLGYLSSEWAVSGYRAPPGLPLNYDQKAFNSAVNSYRVTIENCFSRLKNLFHIMKNGYRGNID